MISWASTGLDAWRPAVKLSLMPYNIRQVQIMKVEESIFILWFCGSAWHCSWPRSYIFIRKLRFIWVDITILRTIRIGLILIRDRLLKFLFMIGRLVCSVPLLLWMVWPIIFEQSVDSERYMSDIPWPYFGSIMEKMVLCKMMLWHTGNYSINILNEVSEDTGKSQIVANKVSRLNSLWYLSVGKLKK
jgi:hypothetical protein